MRTKGLLKEALVLAEQGLLVAVENQNYQHGLDLYYQKILIYFTLGDTLSMMSIIPEYETSCQKYGTAKDFMHYYLVMSLLYDLVGFREKTIEMTKKSIDYAHELNDLTMLVRGHNNLCYLEVEKGCNDEGLQAGLLARKYNQQLSKKLPELARLHDIRINNNLADVYIFKGDFDTAQTLLDSTLNSTIIQHHNREKVAALFGYGFLYEKQDRLQEAVNYYKQSIALAQSYGDNAITKKVMRLLLNVLYQLNWRDEIFEVQRAYIELSEKMGVDNLLQQVMNLEFNRHKEKLEKKALYDPLTGVLNRHFLDIKINEWLFEAKFNKQFVGLTVLDLDYFKLYNDTYGHLFGDRVLQILASGLRDFLQKEDAEIIRFGGDEFVICIRHEQKEYVKELVRELHSYLLTLTLDQYAESETLKVSMGACINEQKNYDYKTLFKHADQCLYQAKKNGRTKCIIDELK